MITIENALIMIFLMIIIFMIISPGAHDTHDTHDSLDYTDTQINQMNQMILENYDPDPDSVPDSTLGIDIADTNTYTSPGSYKIKNPDPKYLDPRYLDSKYEKVMEQIGTLRSANHKLQHDVEVLTNIIDKMYRTDTKGNYVVNGWFAQFHKIAETPGGLVLGEMIHKVYGAPSLCFRTKNGYPFLGPPDKPMFFPKADNIGLRAMTIFKAPVTGFYDFRILADDGIRFYYQKISADVMMNEKNIRSTWDTLIDAWVDRAETWTITKKLYFNQNDLIFLRMDYYELSGHASACVKLRQYHDDKIEEMDLPYKNTFCSLLWSEVPLLGSV